MDDLFFRYSPKRLAPVLAFALVATCAAAQERAGLVIRVYSGDSVELRAANESITVHLADVEAPGPGEPLAAESHAALVELCLGKAATLRETGTAVTGTTIGHVTCGGRSASEEQVRRGLAIAHVRLLPEDTRLLEAQREAQRHQRGVWNR